ncbi:MAG: general secretion pathway protein I [Oceanicoccus sp.]
MNRILPRSQGFTLLEVLIALTILAISSLAVLRQTGQSLSQLQQLEEKNIAIYIVESRIAEFSISQIWPETGRSSKVVTVAGRQWNVNSEISSTSDPWLRKIDVWVVHKESNDQDSPVAALTFYKGRY